MLCQLPSAAISTLVSALRLRADVQGNTTAYTFLGDGETDEENITWAEIDSSAQAIAVTLQESGLSGQRVLLIFPPGNEFICAFFGCLYAGCVAVPLPPPPSKRPAELLYSVARRCSPAGVLAAADFKTRFPEWSRAAELRDAVYLTHADWHSPSRDAWPMPEITAQSVAMLQFTSGSTGNPKGVIITHANLIENQEVIYKAFRHERDSIVVGWLPHYHDMGLIGNILQPVYAGIRCILMPAYSFIQKPARWLRAITRYQGTTSGAPNFAFDLCSQRITDQQIQELDLSSWDLAYCGAERIRAETLEAFTKRFQKCGFRAEAFYPCYGLAEATLFVSGGEKGTGGVIRSYRTASLKERRAIEVPKGTPNSTSIVSCGAPLGVREAIIVDPETHTSRCTREIGEIWLCGPSIAAGYWGSEKNGGDVFQARLEGDRRDWLRTGDLGFFDYGEVHLVGRLKELIIVRGRNHYPQDIERTAEGSHPALCPGRAAAFAIETNDEEALVLTLELQRGTTSADWPAIMDRIRKVVVETHEIPVHAITLVRQRTIPTTTSGKIRRHMCRELFLSGQQELLASWTRDQEDQSKYNGK
jgi:acyl-CoA synthetase (AMP-forming)/AMP-acid ligase II